MTGQDRELLEAAAGAAGIKVSWHEALQCLCYSGSPYHVAWNPLTDDGDALRLAVARDVWIHPGEGREVVEVVGFGSVHEQAGTDRGAATRRAIVRAVAAQAA